jgi:hypothetical protein
MRQKGKRHNPQPAIPGLTLSRSWTRDFRLGTFFLGAAWIFLPVTVFAQGGGGLTIQVFGVVQLEPGPNVLTLAVRNEEIRFAVQDMRCTGQQCSKDRFVSDIKHRTPSLYIRGPEPMLDLLVKEKPSKRVLRLEGLYYLDSRRLVLHDLTPFNEQPKSAGPPQ